MNRMGSYDPSKQGGASRAERRADVRRTRAMSHLERVRGEIPRQSHHPWRRAATAVAAAVVGTFVGASTDGGTFLRRDPRIESISVQGARHLDAAMSAALRGTPLAAAIVAASGVPRNAALGVVEPAAISARLREHDWIAAARTLRLPTGTLVVSVTERIPAGRVVGPASDSVRLVDASGTAFAEAVSEDHATLPLVRTPEPVASQEPNATIARALEIADALRRFGLPSTREIGISREGDPIGFTVRLSSVTPRVILGWEDLDPKLRELSRLLAAELPEFADATELDLRFAGQGILRIDPLPEEAAQAAAARGFAPPST